MRLKNHQRCKRIIKFDAKKDDQNLNTTQNQVDSFASAYSCHSAVGHSVHVISEGVIESLSSSGDAFAPTTPAHTQGPYPGVNGKPMRTSRRETDRLSYLFKDYCNIVYLTNIDRIETH